MIDVILNTRIRRLPAILNLDSHMIHVSYCKLSPSTAKDGNLDCNVTEYERGTVEHKNNELEFRQKLHSSGLVIYDICKDSFDSN